MACAILRSIFFNNADVARAAAMMGGDEADSLLAIVLKAFVKLASAEVQVPTSSFLSLLQLLACWSFECPLVAAALIGEGPQYIDLVGSFVFLSRSFVQIWISMDFDG